MLVITDGDFELVITALSRDLTQGIETEVPRSHTDINLLGRLDGWEVAKQARKIDPSIPIIYMTDAAAEQ